MAMNDKVEKITQISQSVSKAEKPIQIPNKERFDALIDQEVDGKKAALTTQQIEPKRPKTLMEEVRDLNYKVDQVKGSTPDDLVVQADNLAKQIKDLKQKISTPGLKIRSSTQKLLRNRLVHIDEKLKIALTKAGVEYTPPAERLSLATPMERFLGFLSHAEAQLQKFSADVTAMHQNKEEITPANMLLMQIKVSQVQQELEFFTNLLNKALESTKTVMNVQV